jgi:molybdate transport system substrate-binding protein
MSLAIAPPKSLAEDVLVFAAASLADALTEIGANHATASAERVVFNFEASSTLARQIAASAPADVFFSADEAKMDQLQREGLIVESTRRSVLSNSLVVVSPGDSTLPISTIEDLRRPEVQRIALAHPEAVPAGIYAKACLERAGVWANVSARVIPTANVRAALAAVESGNADAGFVFRTDAAISRRARVVLEISVGDCPSITYPVALLAESRNAPSAARFLDYLKTPEAVAVFRRFGFIVLER